MCWTQLVRKLRAYTEPLLTKTDPEVATLTSLTNIQNSLFIPNLGRFVNRRPTYNLQRAPNETDSMMQFNSMMDPARQAPEEPAPKLSRTQTGGTLATLATIDSRMSDSRYAVLPHGTTLDGWSKDDKKELNDHVRHMLHSRRSRFKRSMKGFGQYVKRRKQFSCTPEEILANSVSTWIFGYSVRHLDHIIRSCVGSVLDRLDQRRR